MSLKVTLKDSKELYRLMISQLFYDGYQQVALALANATNEQATCAPSNRLHAVVAAGLKIEKETQPERSSLFEPILDGIDLDYQSESTPSAPAPADYETVYVTSHKGPCRAAAFNQDGSLVATGSVDNSIKILDVEKMINRRDVGPIGDDMQSDAALHPVIRTLYDHSEEVTCLQFHPTEQVLVSGSDDCTVKVYDFSKPSVKRAVKTIQETHPLRTLSIHPTGNYLLVGTLHPTIRLYDINTSQCFVGSNPSDQHSMAVNMISYSSTGSLYATCSEDGDIKIWDGVSSRVINMFPKAHDGNEISSIAFSRNGKYLLSSGKDAVVKLWELSMSRCLIAYTGAGSGKPQFRSQACFNQTEDYVLFPDERTTSLCSWDSRNAERKTILSLGHNNPVRFIAHSPTSSSFITCSDDYRARFWHSKKLHDASVL